MNYKKNTNEVSIKMKYFSITLSSNNNTDPKKFKRYINFKKFKIPLLSDTFRTLYFSKYKKK